MSDLRAFFAAVALGTLVGIYVTLLNIKSDIDGWRDAIERIAAEQDQ